MRRQRPRGRHGITVPLVKLHADVAVKLEVERAHLVPQPVELLCEIVRRHVVFRAPHRARIGKSQLLGALVRQLDEANVVVLDGRRDAVPSFPDTPQLRLVARCRHDAGDVVDVQTALRLRRVWTPLAPPVRGPHAGGNLGQLLGFRRIGRGGHDESHLQEVELTPLIGRHLDLVEAGRFFRKPRGRFDQLPGFPGVDGLGLFGDEVLGDPASLALGDAQTLQCLIDGVEERLRVGGGRCRSCRAPRAAQGGCEHDAEHDAENDVSGALHMTGQSRVRGAATPTPTFGPPASRWWRPESSPPAAVPSRTRASRRPACPL